MQSPRFLDRRSHPHLLTLVFATAYGPLSMNIFLPSIPNIAEHFGTSYVVVQLAIVLHLLANAVLQLLIGPLSDRYGRRPVMMSCFVIAILSTLVIIFAPNIEMMLAGRVAQGSAIGGMVISRAVVRDVAPPREAASRIGYITMGMTLAPMFGPVAGGFLDQWFGWQGPFWATLLIGLFVLLIVWADLGETIPKKTDSFSAQFRSYPILFSSRRFWGYALASAASTGAFFAFLGGSSYLASTHFGIAPAQYGFYFLLTGVGYFTGNFISGRFSSRVGINNMVLGGGLAGVIGMSISLSLFLAGFDYALCFFVPMVFIGIGNGMTLPNSIAGMVSVRPEIAGSASGIGGSMQIGGGALFSVLGGAVLGPDSGAIPLILIMLGSCALSVLAALYVIRVASLVEGEESMVEEGST